MIRFTASVLPDPLTPLEPERSVMHVMNETHSRPNEVVNALILMLILSLHLEIKCLDSSFETNYILL